MPNSILQFGTSVDLIDPATQDQVSPKVAGDFSFQVRDPALFASRAPAMGGEPKIAAGTQAAVAEYVKEAIVAAVGGGTPVKALAGKMTELAAGVATRINGELAAIGAGIQFGSVNLTFSPEDQARLGGAPSPGMGGAPGKGKGMPMGAIAGGLVAVLVVVGLAVHFMHHSSAHSPEPEHEKHGKH